MAVALGRSSSAIAALASAIGCGARPPPRPPPVPPEAQLRADLSAIFAAPQLAPALVAVEVVAVDPAEVLFERDATKLAIPASTLKVITLAAAAERLGWDYRYETRLVASAPIVDGVLRGDLVVVGSGDPSLNDRHGGAGVAYAKWVEQLRAAGIRAIAGDLVGDDRAFAEDPVGAGWAWDDLAEGWAAPVGALQVRDNAIKIGVRPADTAGKPAIVEVPPADAWLELVNRAITVDATVKPSLELRRWPGTTPVDITGNVPLGQARVATSVAVPRPTDFFLRELATGLRERGIELRGRTRTGVAAGAPRVLASYQSPPLAELATVMMKSSHNGYAETLLRTLGAATGPGSAARGVAVVGEVLAGWDIPAAGYVLRDGSGMSRLDYVTAQTMVAVLRHVYGDPRHRDHFVAALSVAGQDGTLRNRMIGTPAQGNVRAKTGTMTGVRCLAGFVTTKDGETVAFAILSNAIRAPVSAFDRRAEAALLRLVEFSRRATRRTDTATGPRSAASRTRSR